MSLSKLIVLLFISLMVSACGGGSSDKVSTPTVEIPDNDTGSGDEGSDNGGSGNDNDNSDQDSGGGDGDQDTAPTEPTEPTQPNILFILSDDQGLDASAQYDVTIDKPVTPTLDALASAGITFDNAWVTPACTTTRAAILTGKYGKNSGVNYVPATLSAEHQVLQAYLKANNATENYQSAVFGKWHLAGGNPDANHPQSVGIEYYAGNLSNVEDYFDWSLTINGEQTQETSYNTTKLTDLAIDWVKQQTQPWFVWLAYSAPHSPIHLPPTDLHDRNLSGSESDIENNRRQYYLAAIEAMDSEIGRLLDSFDSAVRDNTIIIFMGDNGTPSGVIDQTYYARSHAKGSLYQGGVAVPLVISGKNVTRQNVRESALVSATDLYATIANIAGIESTQVHDSTSFASLLSNAEASTPSYVYTEFQSDDVSGWAVRSKDYKLINYADGSQVMYSLVNHFKEETNLLPTTDSDIAAAQQALETIGDNINGTSSQSPIDITNALLTNNSGNCADYVESFTSNVMDVNRGQVFMGDLVISVIDDKCIFNTNAIPNHDFNDGGNAFPNDVSEQNDRFEITIAPTKAAQTTALSLEVDNAILLNGVKVDLLAAGCFGIGNGKVGCNDMSQPWRYDPMHPANGFNVDTHNAHAQPDGTYHYHGSPFALFADDSSQPSPVIGFAADGFPIFGSYFDDNGNIRKALSSYRLKSGERPSGNNQPGGNYDGAFRDDYEYVEGLGDLDECNGMTKDGVYGYYITDNYPYVIACFKGTPDQSFVK